MDGLSLLAEALSDAFDWFAGWPADAAMVVLGAVLVWSGAAKLNEPVRVAFALMDLKVTRSLRPGIARLLSVGEFALGLALMAGMLAAAPARAALVGLAAIAFVSFAVVIARTLRSGDKVACACFGASDTPMTALTFTRTAGLALLACLTIAAQAPSETAGQQSIVMTYVAALSTVGIVALLNIVRGYAVIPQPTPLTGAGWPHSMEPEGGR